MSNIGWMDKRLRTISDQVIYSVAQHRVSDMLRLAGAAAMPFVGCYKGRMELSFMLPRNSFDWMVHAEPALMAEQASYLVLNNARLGWTVTEHFLNGDAPIALGEFKAIDTDYHDLHHYDGWTYDPSSNTYYVCSIN